MLFICNKNKGTMSYLLESSFVIYKTIRQSNKVSLVMYTYMGNFKINNRLVIMCFNRFEYENTVSNCSCWSFSIFYL